MEKPVAVDAAGIRSVLATYERARAKNLGIGVGYRYEKFEIVDFATTDVTPGVPRMDPLGAITTGYGNRPFTGSTAVVKLIYKF